MRTLRAAIVACAAIAACQPNATTGPGEIAWDRDTCERCAMAIGDRRFAAQVRDSRGGRLHFFDDLGCALGWIADNEPEADLSASGVLPELWVRDGAGERWIDARTARFTGGHQTPMGYGFGAASGDPARGSTLHEVATLLIEREDERRQPGH
jgi:nitrous oxide reductase accessory protein NosL